MDVLRELTHILTKKKLHSLEIINPDLDKKSKLSIFYHGLLENKFNSDQEAAQFLYQSNPNDANYKSLKSNLKKRLVNSIFFLNLRQPTYSNYEQSYFFCCKYLAVAKILIRLQATRSGMIFCEKVFKKAVENEFPDFIADSSRFLRGYYAIRKVNLNKFEFYNDSYKQAEKDRIAENLAYEYYLLLMVPYAQEKSSKEETYLQAKTYIEELKPYYKNCSSSYFHMLYFYIQVIINMSMNNYEDTVKVCDEAIDYFDSKPYLYKTALNIFLHNKLACHTQLKQYEKGILLEKKTLANLQAGTYNWYRDRELFFILSMHTQNYQAAYEKFIMAISHRRFRFLNPIIKEMWKIYEAYLHLLFSLGKLVPAKDDTRFNNFRLGKFLNSVPIFSKDKRGINIPILIIQISFMIIKKDYDRAIDRIEAIEKYCFRYIKKKDNYRSNVFIKMLLLLPKSGFHKSGVERKSQELLDQLKSSPLEIARQIHEIEIIPYEDLWEFISMTLETKFYKK